MPELPEVEITRRHLAEATIGRAITEAEVNHPRTARHNASQDEIENRLRDRTVTKIGRHGKFLVWSLDDGQSLVAHLGMSGRFRVASPETETEKHTHFVAHLDDGSEVRFIDPRTFGFIAVFDEDELSDSSLSRLGPDAWLDPPDLSTFANSLSQRTAPIKALLLDQAPLAGLGNIYADEVLHLAGIHPSTPGGHIGRKELETLLSAVNDVLRQAIDSGGTTLDDLSYLLPDGRAGDNFGRLSVYGRESQECPKCGSEIERIVIRSRSTFFCPNCQSL